jgi:hypothetical protein
MTPTGDTGRGRQQIALIQPLETRHEAVQWHAPRLQKAARSRKGEHGTCNAPPKMRIHRDQ